MGLLGRLTGREKKAAQEPQQPVEEAAPAVAAAPVSAKSEMSSDMSEKFGPPSLSMPSMGAAGPMPTTLQGMTLPTSSGKVYDPYEGLSSVVGTKKHVFRLPEQPEFVFEEESAVRKRGWTENLQFYTGGGYLAGGLVGAAAGLYKYATVKPEIPLDTWRLKANRLLNSAGSLAKPGGNAIGILGLFFSSFESALVHNVDIPGVPEAAYTLAAGALSGALFRSPRGPRQALAAAVVGTAGGASIAALRTVFPSL